MKFDNIANTLKNNKGSAVPFILPVVFCVLCLVAMFWQTGIMIMTASKVKTAMQNVALLAITENSDESYAAKREGFTGAFKKGMLFEDTAQIIDVTTHLKEQLNISQNVDVLTKYSSSGNIEYLLKNISLRVNNTVPLDDCELFDTIIELDLLFQFEMPIIGSREIPIHLKASAINESKY